MDDAHARTLLREELRRIDHELADRRSGGPLRPDESDRRAVDEADRASRETETMEADLAEGTLRTQRRGSTRRSTASSGASTGGAPSAEGRSTTSG